MTNIELARFITEFIMTEKETVLEAIEKNDGDLICDEAYEYIENCN